MSNAANTLARGRKTSNWLAIALAASVVINIATPVYYSLQSKVRDQVVVFDLASGSLLLSPLVDPCVVTWNNYPAMPVRNCSERWAQREMRRSCEAPATSSAAIVWR